MAKQLRRKPVNRKNATRDKERSSRMVREDAKMDRKVAGVTGMRLEESFGRGWGFG